MNNLLFQIGFLSINWIDILDIALVGILLYQAYRLMRGTRATRILVGFLILYFVFLIVKSLKMDMVSALLEQFTEVGVIALIILFQQEIRRFLLIIARNTVFRRTRFYQRKGLLWSLFGEDEQDMELDVKELMDAIQTLSARKWGALVVLTRESKLDNYVESGDALDAKVSKRLLLTIFNKEGPLHDGAVIIYKNRILAARCVLPVSERINLPAQYGMRHRAAIGITEQTDAIAVVASEETGAISAFKGQVAYRNLNSSELRSIIQNYLQNG